MTFDEFVQAVVTDYPEMKQFVGDGGYAFRDFEAEGKGGKGYEAQHPQTGVAYAYNQCGDGLWLYCSGREVKAEVLL